MGHFPYVTRKASAVNLIEKLAAPVAKKPTSKSVMDVWVETRPATEQAAILTAAENPEWGHIALRDELVKEGAPELSDTAFRQWRRKHGWTK